jgi:hypothetical protein
MQVGDDEIGQVGYGVPRYLYPGLRELILHVLTNLDFSYTKVHDFEYYFRRP